MGCITVVAPVTMATTRLARAVHYEQVSASIAEQKVERKALQLSWVVTTDWDGTRRLHMRWMPSADFD